MALPVQLKPDLYQGILMLPYQLAHVHCSIVLSGVVSVSFQSISQLVLHNNFLLALKFCLSRQ